MLGPSLLRQTYLIGVFFRTCKHPVNYKCKSTHSQGKLAVLFEVWCNEYDPERPVWLKDPRVWRVIRRQNTVLRFTVRQDLTALESYKRFLSFAAITAGSGTFQIPSSCYKCLRNLPGISAWMFLVGQRSANILQCIVLCQTPPTIPEWD